MYNLDINIMMFLTFFRYRVRCQSGLKKTYHNKIYNNNAFFLKLIIRRFLCSPRNNSIQRDLLQINSSLFFTKQPWTTVIFHTYIGRCARVVLRRPISWRNCRTYLWCSPNFGAVRIVNFDQIFTIYFFVPVIFSTGRCWLSPSALMQPKLQPIV